jgi:hypothetical protein
VTALSGLLNKPGLAVYSTEPGPEPLLVADLGDEAERATPRVEVDTRYRGPARVAAVTVSYQGLAPARCTVLADTPAGTRCIASSDDAKLAERATREELVGTTVSVDGTRLVAAQPGAGG